MPRAIDKRPERTGTLCIIGCAREQAGANAEEDAASKSETLSLCLPPWKWLDQWQPCILELREFRASHISRHELRGYGLKPWLRRHSLVQLVQALAPPGHSDRAKPRVAARCHDIGKRQVQIPQGSKCGPNILRHLLDRDLDVGIESPLSDR